MALQAALTGAPGPVPGPVLDAGPPPLPPTFSFGVPASPPGESTTSPHGLSGIPALSSPSPLRTAIEAPALPLSGHISQPIVPPVSSTTSPVYGVMSPPPVGIPPLPPSLPPVPSPTHEIAGVGDRAAAAPVGAEAGPSRPLPDPLLVNQHDAASRELGNMLLIDILRVSRLGLNRSVSKPCVRVHLISESTGRHIPSALTCDVVDAHIEGRSAENKIFPGETCYAGSGLLTAVVALLCLPLLMMMALLNSIGDFDPNMLSYSLLASPTGQGATRWTILSTIMVVCIVIWRREPYMVGLVVVVVGSKALWDTIRGQYYYRTHVNCTKAGMVTSVVGVGLVVMIVGFTESTSAGIESAMVAMLALGWAAGYALMLLQARSRRAFAERLVEGGLETSDKGKMASMNRDSNNEETEVGGALLASPHVVEICSRCVRDQDHCLNYDQASQARGELILRRGIQAYPDSPLLTLQYANFLRLVRNDTSAALAQIMRATKLPMGINMRMVTFWIDKEHKSFVQDQGYGSDGAMDITSFMEFQQAFKSAQMTHSAAFRSSARFWRLLLRKEITFKAMVDVMRRMNTMERMAAKLYKAMVDRYPNNVKLLRSYGRFMEEVATNPWKAMRMYNEADKIEDAQDERKRDQLLTSAVENGGEDLSATVDDQTDAIVCINEVGVIQMTNKLLNQMLGYRAGELDGLNVNVLMPPPFSHKHNGYLRTFKANKWGPMIGTQNKVLAMRKDKSVLPVNIRVTKLNSTGESEGTFIGIMHPSSDDETGGPEGRMLVWIASDGNVVAVNKAFASVTGFGTPDIQGKPLSSVGAPNSRWDELIAEARDELGITATGAELPGMPAAEGQERLKELRKPITGKMRHKYSRENFAMSGAVRAVGTGDGAMVEVEFSTSAALDGVAVFDLQGRMMYANRALEQMLGYDEGFPDVRRMTLDKVLPPPLAQFHTPLLKAVVMSGEQPPEHVPCFRGHLVFLEGKNRAHVPARLHWWPQRQGTSMAFIVIAQPASVPDELVPWGVTSATRLQDACISLTAVTTSDGVIAGVGCGLGFTRHGIPGDVFGMDAASMRGRSLSDYIDVLQALVQNAQLYSKVEPREVLGQMMRQLCAAKRDQVLQSFRASVICASRTGSVPDYVPIRFTVEPVTGSGVSVAALSHRSEVDPALGKRIGVEGGYVVRIWSSNWINAHLMVAKDGTVRGGNHTLEVLLGEKTEKLQGKPLSSVIAQSDLLARLRKGETRILCQATHADGSTFSVSVSGGSKQGAQTVDLLVRGIYEEPGNSIESLRRMEATVGEDGLADAQEKPLESSIKHTQAPGKKAKKKGVNFAEDVVQEDGPASKAAEVEAPKAKAKEAEVAAPKHKEVEEKRERDPEAGSQAASTDGYAGPGAGMQAQLKRAKRFKHLRRLLDMSDASMFARTVRQRIPLFVLLAIALHAVLFGVYTSLVLASRDMVDATRVAGRPTMLAEYVATDIESFQAMFDACELHGRYPEELDEIITEMAESATELGEVTMSMYIDTKLDGIKSALRDELYETPSLEILKYHDSVPPEYIEDHMGLLQLSEAWVQAAENIVRMKDPQVLLDMWDLRNFQFLVQNTHKSLVPALDQMLVAQAEATVKDMENLQQTALIIAVVQSVIIVPAFVAVMYFHIFRLNQHRRALFSVFLGVPRHVAMRLATVQQEEEGAEGGEPVVRTQTVEMDDAVMGGKQSSLFAWTSRADRVVEMDSATRNVLLFRLAPMILLTGLIFGLHMSSYLKIMGTLEPLNDLVATERMLGEVGKVRYWANQLTFLHWKSEMYYSRQALLDQVDSTQYLWKSLLHGNPEENLTGSVLNDPAQVEIIQGQECLRIDKTLCRPSDNMYYEDVSHGLGVLLEIYLTNARYWTAVLDGVPDDPVDYLMHMQPSQELIWQLGNKEVPDGIRILALMQQDSIFGTLISVVAVEGALLGCACLVTFLYLWILQPYLKNTAEEVERTAKLLSQLPAAMNVETMLGEMLDIHSQDMTQSSETLAIRIWHRIGELVGRCFMGRRFKLLLELEKAHLQQKAAAERAKREKVEKELTAGTK